ncbi:MAG: hypothetical protein ABIH23_01950 [bacterium]
MKDLSHQKIFSIILTIALSAVVFSVLWSLRSWDLWNGDGEFCCKQTVGETTFAITLSRCPLSHLGYRYLFRALRPLTNWWVEDIIALSSCAAGLVFFWALVLLVRRVFSARANQMLYAALCSSSLLLQMFCGHIEFYPWTCALLMVFILLGWDHLTGRLSILWPSAVLTLATAFHSSAVFYFPGLLVLEYFRQSRDAQNSRRTILHGLLCFGLLVCAAPFHREQGQYALFLIVCLAAWFAWGLAPERIRVWRDGISSWLIALVPWLIYFSIRTALGLYPEPILHHIAPMGGEYDPGSFLYTFWSWDHLHDKLLFQWWLSPFAIPVGCLIVIAAGRQWLKNGWFVFLGVLSLSALAWEVLFYPQLRIRDWDLFASTAIPFNLLVGYGVLVLWKRGRLYLTSMILIQLFISVPIILKNSDLLVGRGYATVECWSQPVPAEVFIRGLPVGHTPLTMENVRSGRANIVLIPSDRNYRSAQLWRMIEPGEHLFVDEILPYHPTPLPRGRTGEK